MIRILIAEDSPVVSEYLTHLLHEDPKLRVVGAARNGREAVAKALRLKPDIVLMDIHMPEMNGYDATREIMARAPMPIVIVSASYEPENVAKTFSALQAGALTVIEKPAGMNHPRKDDDARRLVQTVRLMASVKVARRRKGPVRAKSPLPLKCKRRLGVVAIGASTGGPPVVAEILKTLPASFPAPLLLVQHIAPGFVAGLVEWLRRETQFEVKLAEAGAAVRAGTVYVAPDGFQLEVNGEHRLRLARATGGDRFCPSVSHLFESVAKIYGSAAAGVLLTGMGSDGASGLRRMRDGGAVTIVQDRRSCTVFGMPAEAIRLDAAEHILPPAAIARTLADLGGINQSENHEDVR